MSRLIDRTGPIEDRWTRVEGEEAPLPDGPVIVDFTRLATVEHAPLGVHVPNDTAPETLAGDFDRLDLVCIEFPSFADGRGFSIATKLRDLGYAGRIRAAGPVIVDQFAYLLECGVDEVLLPEKLAERQPPEQWAAALARAGQSYQRGRSGARASILEQRRAGHG